MIGRGNDTITVVNFHGTIESGHSKPGLLGSSNKVSMDIMQPLLDKAFSVPNLAAVCITINSPGGAPVQAELIANYIRTLAKFRKVKVYAFIEDSAVSGGYWIACAADKIYCCRCSMVGSIGVILSSFGFVKFIEKWGVERRVYTAGKSKNIMDPFSEVGENEKKAINRALHEVHKNFKNHVRTRRGDRLRGPQDTLFSGEFWVGEEAVHLGLCDGILTLNEFLGRYGSKVKVKRIVAKPQGLAGLLGARMSDKSVSKVLVRFVERFNRDEVGRYTFR